MKENILNALKGFFMGAANVIPGVSGGTVALLTGIYGKLVESIAALTLPSTWKSLLKGHFKEFLKAVNFTFLLWLGVGIVVSILSLAKLMEHVLEHYPVQTWAFFFGLILASAVVMAAGIKGWSWREGIFVVLGAVLGVAVSTLTPTQTPDSLWFIFLCGAISICTMILPGVSGSFVLLVLGKYDYVMKALDVTDFNIPVVVVFALGCGVGILAFAKFLHWLLARWEKQTMILLLGFIIGSLVKVWPWSNPAAIAKSQGLEIPGLDVVKVSECLPWSSESIWSAVNPHVGAAVLWCVVGAACVAVLEISSRRMKK